MQGRQLSQLKVWTDADWAGLYTLIGEKRSRTGLLVTYDGVPVAWKSSFQQCKGTMAKPGTETDDCLITTSSGESEVHAASDGVKLGLHIKYFAEETEVPVPTKIPVHIDAGAAIRCHGAASHRWPPREHKGFVTGCSRPALIAVATQR